MLQDLEKKLLDLRREITILLSQVFLYDHFATFLSPEERKMLCDSPVENDDSLKLELCGYPQTPLTSHLANYFALIMLTGECPIVNTPYSEKFDEGYHIDERLFAVSLIREQLQGALTLWDFWSDEEKMLMLGMVLSRLRRRGLLDLLHLRRTTGSREVMLIPRHRLIEAASAPYRSDDPYCKLTVCERALSKHSIRDSSGWWSNIPKEIASSLLKTGYVSKALAKLIEILNNAMWINIHELPGSLPTLEIRMAAGYGARFDYEPLRFRGFLEPHQIEGWLTGYRH